MFDLIRGPGPTPLGTLPSRSPFRYVSGTKCTQPRMGPCEGMRHFGYWKRPFRSFKCCLLLSCVFSPARALKQRMYVFPYSPRGVIWGPCEGTRATQEVGILCHVFVGVVLCGSPQNRARSMLDPIESPPCKVDETKDCITVFLWWC